jgi:hypothetical protein
MEVAQLAGLYFVPGSQRIVGLPTSGSSDVTVIRAQPRPRAFDSGSLR